MTRLCAFMFIVFTVVLCSNSVHTCTSNGVCSGGCCNPPCQQPAVHCTPSSCSPGYSCGQFGCARNRARSALTRKDGSVVPIDEFTVGNFSAFTLPGRNIYGIEERGTADKLSAGKQGEKINLPAYTQLTNPNFLFRQCCEDRRLPDACLRKCHFNTFTKQALQAMFFKLDPCPIEASADLQYCAAMGRNHAACCLDSGVQTTLAGEKCLAFCDQRMGKVTRLDYSYLPCYDKFEQMKLCFFHSTKSRMEKKLKQRFEDDVA